MRDKHRRLWEKEKQTESMLEEVRLPYMVADKWIKSFCYRVFILSLNTFNSLLCAGHSAGA